MDRRIGKFYVSRRFIEDSAITDGPPAGSNLIHGMVILRSQCDFAADRWEYIAVHEDFNELPEGSHPPLYRPVFKDGAIYPNWVLEAS